MSSFPHGAQASVGSRHVFDVHAGAAETPARAEVTALYDRVCGGAPGFVVARAASPEAARAVSDYVSRLASTTGALALSVVARPGAPLWREVAMKLLTPADGESARSLEPGAAAQHLVAAARGRRVVVVAPIPAARTWDAAVALEIAVQPHPYLVVFVGHAGDSAHVVDADALHADLFELPARLSGGERESWWSVLAESAASELEELDLPELEAWWTRARHASPTVARQRRELTKPEATLLAALTIAARPWRQHELLLLGASMATAHALVRDGFVHESMGWLTVDSHLENDPTKDVPQGTLAAIANALVAQGPGDAWALARAAELHVLAGDVAAADAAIERALAQVEDSVARSELVVRWTAAVESCPPDERLGLQRRAVERALAVGEAEEANRWARAAAALAPDDGSVALLLGRALVALGDLVAAEVALRRGRASASPSTDAVTMAAVSAELSEIAYLRGDMASAARAAEEAMACAGVAVAGRGAFAKARNTLGKILLAGAKWDEADRHFAEDAQAAAAHGDATSELRSRLNRGIAFLSRGALDEARSMFEEVEREGERLGDYRACAFALDNLAVVATWRHEYADALALSERTLKLRRRLGDRLTTARIVGSLAELRRKLGLVDHAEHAVAFGRRSLGPGMPPERGAHFSVVAARIALERRHTDVAQREVERAIRDAALAGNKKLLAEAHRVGARVALEDGDLVRARASIEAAGELTATDEARAEVALVEALLARALGEDAERLALSALHLAKVVGEEELLLDAHILLCEIHRAAGQVDAARSHVTQAVALRDQVTRGLPADVAAAFVARRDVKHLARLDAQLATAEAEGPATRPEDRDSELPSTLDVSRASRPSSPAIARASAVEMIGADPAMRALQSTIKKVARSNSTVLIRGESGTGKELVAAALHRASDRAQGPMVTVNCAALVETLLLSELFGHEKGAFTGATARKRGRFELAEGGTLFLDEIGDISAKTQVALLRVLQERTFERVGGTSPIHVDVHIICATHRDLRGMVERGEFREDLYYRLRGIALDVPALRSRPGDLPALADHLLGRIAAERAESKKSLAPAALELLTKHTWPGNVRELENALRAASLFADADVIDARDLTENVDDLRKASEKAGLSRPRLRPDVAASRDSSVPAAAFSAPASSAILVDDGANDPDDLGDDLPGAIPSGEAQATAVAYAQIRQGALSLSDLKRQIERDCITRALAETKGNITRAATLLGMKRPRLSQLVKHYGLCAVSSEAS